MSNGELGFTEFGGHWTEQKLNILKEYLDTFTTAMKNQSFQLIYIDAFAGSGYVSTIGTRFDRSDLFEIHNESIPLIEGSAERAARIDGKPFDRLIFVDVDERQCDHLKQLELNSYDRNISIVQSDANDFITKLKLDWRRWRGVLFLDPFGTQLRMETLERIAQIHALDAWILFPAGTIARLLPRSIDPKDIKPALIERLNAIYGDNSWQSLYSMDHQESLTGLNDPVSTRERGTQGLTSIYKEKLKQKFGDRLIEESAPLLNSKGAHLFELFFCVGNERGISLASRVVKHILATG